MTWISVAKIMTMARSSGVDPRKIIVYFPDVNVHTRPSHRSDPAKPNIYEREDEFDEFAEEDFDNGEDD